jgi:DNA replication protein DnaC
MELETVRHQLRQLRLMTAAQEIDSVLEKTKKAVQLDWVSTLFERELDARKENALKLRIQSAKFPAIKTWEGFDFGFNDEIEKEKLEELKSLSFIKQNRIVQFLGSPGTGKSHLATALGVIAAHQGYKVYWSSAKKLQADIFEAKLHNNLDQLFKKILSAQLWIYDDFGVVSYPRDIAEEVFDLLDRRKHSSAMILTSNRAVEEWAQVFPDAVLANAAIDRMFEQAIIHVFVGKSYRLNGKMPDKKEIGVDIAVI